MPISQQTKDRVEADLHMIQSGISMAIAGYMHMKASRDDALAEGDATEDTAVNSAASFLTAMGTALTNAQTAKNNLHQKLKTLLPGITPFTGT